MPHGRPSRTCWQCDIKRSAGRALACPAHRPRISCCGGRTHSARSFDTFSPAARTVGLFSRHGGVFPALPVLLNCSGRRQSMDDYETGEPLTSRWGPLLFWTMFILAAAVITIVLTQ
jgi:hypothetical protein